MSSTKIEILGREYEIACDNGQEQHLAKLADEVEKRARAISGNIKRASAENTTLIMTLITYADEIHDLKKEMAELKSKGKPKKAVSEDLFKQEEMLTIAINSASTQIEDLLNKLE